MQFFQTNNVVCDLLMLLTDMRECAVSFKIRLDQVVRRMGLRVNQGHQEGEGLQVCVTYCVCVNSTLLWSSC